MMNEVHKTSILNELEIIKYSLKCIAESHYIYHTPSIYERNTE